MDDRLIDLVERWDELGWFDKKHIWWILFKYKTGITSKQIFSLATGLSIIVVLICEHHPNYFAGLLSLIVLLHFYIALYDYMANSKPKTA